MLQAVILLLLSLSWPDTRRRRRGVRALFIGDAVGSRLIWWGEQVVYQVRICLRGGHESKTYQRSRLRDIASALFLILAQRLVLQQWPFLCPWS